MYVLLTPFHHQLTTPVDKDEGVEVGDARGAFVTQRHG